MSSRATSLPSAPRAPKSYRKSESQEHRSQSNNNQGNRYSRPLPPKDPSSVTILKRGSVVAPVVAEARAHNPSTPTSNHVNHTFNHHNNNRPQKPRPPQNNPSKARRVQRRKDVDAMTESLASLDFDLAMHQSPPLNPSSPPSSSSDSSDSESTLRLSPLVQNMSRAPRQTRPISAPVPQNYARQSFAMDQLRSQGPNSDRVNNRPQEKNGLYAGPTFHNSPAPTSLPIPAFLQGGSEKASGKASSTSSSPIVSSASASSAASPSPFFAEAASPQLNSARPIHSEPGWGHQSMPPMMVPFHPMMMPMPHMVPMPYHHSMPMPLAYHPHPHPHPHPHAQAHPHPHMAYNYNVPERMATSSFTPNESSDQLLEISQNLRNLLKIQSQ
ncbi:hypothetical protein CPB97_004201 [Podila verticillata]|nr:hypothetical protein CPB97_004201 [Podila verticillata]